MPTELTVLGIVAAVVIGFLFGKRQRGPQVAAEEADASFFVTTPGDDGFCRGKVLKKRMKGRQFFWARKGMGCNPSPGSYFEMRVKSGTSPMIPPRPRGVDNLRADVESGAKPGQVYFYSLYQVLADGSERLLHDPELEIGQI